MAIKIYEQFAPFANPADGDHPYGSFKNDSIPGAEDGTPLDAVWANDYAGFDAELFAQAGIVPNGSADKLGASQRVDAIKQLIDDQYTTVAELATGKFHVGMRCRLTDRHLGLFEINGVGWPQAINGIDILDAGGGNVGVYHVEDNVNILHLGADRTGVTDTSAIINVAISYGAVANTYAPKGNYLVESPCTVISRWSIKGDGYNDTIFVSNTDVEVFNSSNTTPSTSVFNVTMTDLCVKKTLSGATTKYDIRFYNPNFCKFIRVRVQSGHTDTMYSDTNIGGIYLEKPTGSTTTAFCNLLQDCWVQNNSLKMKAITDSGIEGGFYWGHTRRATIELESCGAVAVESVLGLISSKFKGGVYVHGANSNQLRFKSIEFDGNPALDIGIGINLENQTTTTTIMGNTFWACGRQGVLAVDPIGMVVTGNTFWKCNRDDNGYSDVAIIGKTFSPNGNIVANNTHVIDDSRANKGYAIEEINQGFNPVNNSYQASVNGQYNDPSILILQQATCVGSSGIGTRNVTNLNARKALFNTGSGAFSESTTIAQGGSLTIAVGGTKIAGRLNIVTSRTNSPTLAKAEVLSIVGASGVGVVTSESSQSGSGGTTVYTVTYSSGNIVINNTTPDSLVCTVSFAGVFS